MFRNLWANLPVSIQRLHWRTGGKQFMPWKQSTGNRVFLWFANFGVTMVRDPSFKLVHG